MPETFHSFGRLPPELRDKIWKLAIRPGGPARRGAHIFSIYDGSGDDVDKAVVVAASCFKFHHNFSTYLIDGGLWNACKESRLLIERVFDSKKWDAVRDRRLRSHTGNPVQVKGEHLMPATGYFRGDDSTDRYFTVVPYRDLFCLQPEILDYFNCEDISKPDGVALGSTRWGFHGLQNIALEYDPAWGITVEKADLGMRHRLSIVESIIQPLFNAKGLSYVWLIDYRIKRRHYVPTKEETTERDPIIFYGSDRRFVEVLGNKWETAFEDKAEIDSSCDNFIRIMEEAIEHQLDVIEARLMSHESSADWNRVSRFLKIPHLRVLACEYI
ncbi:uncharacterized protein F4817DRAFT_352899 [Daldinia loculata]|uniref:uncharacterized protein n=1 Tax=Daldinia loculata TaxID=103429 RepID=UPI0020C1BD2E|nr:uncharacterized protein F4817DRAFT_352899 [Daldinia loculata]KAI1642462.1 hypothetical protein F4817DRAFT_352899 [Daldinia loculata]